MYVRKIKFWDVVINYNQWISNTFLKCLRFPDFFNIVFWNQLCQTLNQLNHQLQVHAIACVNMTEI